MRDQEPAWMRLMLDPLLKIGEGLLMVLITIAGVLVWFVLATFIGLSYLGGRRGGKG